MATIAANLIVLNEASVLQPCLETLGWVDQIVVVDGGSCDETVAVARAYGAHVVHARFRDFATQRNVALEHTRCDWVLSIDADERVSPALRREIQTILASPHRYAGYYVPIHSWIFGRRFRWSGTQHEVKLRLFRRDAGRWVGAVHERPEVRGRLGRLRGPIVHMSTRDVDHWLHKAARYGRHARPTRSAFWSAGAMLVRRLLVSAGFLDGPQGVAFALLSAYEAWVNAQGRQELFTDEAYGWHGVLLRVARCLAGAGRRRGSALRVGQARSACRCPRRAA